MYCLAMHSQRCQQCAGLAHRWLEHTAHSVADLAAQGGHHPPVAAELHLQGVNGSANSPAAAPARPADCSLCATPAANAPATGAAEHACSPEKPARPCASCSTLKPASAEDPCSQGEPWNLVVPVQGIWAQSTWLACDSVHYSSPAGASQHQAYCCHGELQQRTTPSARRFRTARCSSSDGSGAPAAPASQLASEGHHLPSVTPGPARRPPSQDSFHSQTTRPGLADCLEALHAGDSYELCLTTTLTRAGAVCPRALYRTLRQLNPAPMAGFLEFGGSQPLTVCVRPAAWYPNRAASSRLHIAGQGTGSGMLCAVAALGRVMCVTMPCQRALPEALPRKAKQHAVCDHGLSAHLASVAAESRSCVGRYAAPPQSAS